MVPKAFTYICVGPGLPWALELRDEEAKVGGKGGNQWCWTYALRYRKRATAEIKESGRMKERHVKMHQRRLTKN